MKKLLFHAANFFFGVKPQSFGPLVFFVPPVNIIFKNILFVWTHPHESIIEFNNAQKI